MARDKALMSSKLYGSADLIQAFASRGTDTRQAGLQVCLGNQVYTGILQMADFSGTFEFNALEVKLYIDRFGLLDVADVTFHMMKLVEHGKVILFEDEGRTYGWAKNFLRHQTHDKPALPTLPKPPWVELQEGKDRWKRKYVIDWRKLGKRETTIEEDIKLAQQILGVGADHPHVGFLFEGEDA